LSERERRGGSAWHTSTPPPRGGDSLRLAGKVAFVTGAAHGIGRAIAIGLARAGAKVVVADRDGEAASAVADLIASEGGVSSSAAFDVVDRDHVERHVAEAAPDIVVCSAGINHRPETSGILELTDAEWNRILDVNLRGTFLCIQAAAAGLVSSNRRGSIITVASIAVVAPTVGPPAYHASKGGVVALTRSAAVSLAPYGIRVNSLAPGYVLTAMTVQGLDSPETWTAVHRRIPLGRMGEPDDFVGGAVYLASDESSFVTGQVLTIDGGTTAQGWTPAEIPPLPLSFGEPA
jgi:NAD(P)-dependent dehydrogenase (short-subunit alcohol dehydrogenase family)